MLEIDNLDRILSDSCEEARRLFNMIIEHKALEDKDVTLKFLLPLHIVKKALFMLHSNGFVLLKYSAAKESKPILQWQDSFTYDCRGNQEKTERWIGSGESEMNALWMV
jgi:transcription initiation factor IIE alpha subunit